MPLAIVTVVDGDNKGKEYVDLVLPVKVIEVDVESLLFGESTKRFPATIYLVRIHNCLSNIYICSVT